MAENKSQKLRLAIHQALLQDGPDGLYERMKDQFPEVSRATFYRHLKEVREEMESRASDIGTAELRTMQKRIRAHVVTPEIKKGIKANLPVAPSPASLVDMGDGITEVFNFVAHFNRLLNDADMLRSAAVRVADDGTEKLNNPVLMDKSISRRVELIETWLRSQNMIWNLETIQQLYQAVIEEVGKVDPTVQQAILTRIRTLNNRTGMTAGASLS